MKITVEINQPPRIDLVGKQWDGMVCTGIRGFTESADVQGYAKACYKMHSVETWISGNWDEAIYPKLEESPFKA